ncbi:ribosomal protein S5 domain 2-type protein [Paraphysoderma sedebokerense]|nr:ribosomal protein S5 domain 2-type protein [Paraphysoderma sedebokerense]
MTDAMEVDHVPENSTIQFDVQTIKKLHPKEYYRKFISQQIRPDGRGLRRFRKVQIVTGSVSSAEGSAMVKMGNTSVMCGIKAEVSTPPVNSPDIGYFVPNIELSPLCSSKFRPGPPSDMAQTLSAELNEMITKSKVVNLENLCIEEGLASWVIYADIYCLNYDGNIFDACLIALLAALKSGMLLLAVL